ncbi:hypothetical protein GCM10027578_04420 [Spirosoma luteolum]
MIGFLFMTILLLSLSCGIELLLSVLTIRYALRPDLSAPERTRLYLFGFLYGFTGIALAFYLIVR